MLDLPRDPDFAVKAERVLDLYDRRWKGRRLRPDEYVISADEKPGVQALLRAHPSLRAGPARPPRIEFEYRRGGTLAYLAAYDVHHATVFGRCGPTIGSPTGTAPQRSGSAARQARARRLPACIAATRATGIVCPPRPVRGRWPVAAASSWSTGRGRPAVGARWRW